MSDSSRSYEITMLGSFSVSNGEKVLSDTAGRMQQVWNLIEYLIIHRSQGVSQTDLIDMLWPDDSSDNPANALKNLAYRARTLIQKALPGEDRPFILFRRNSYTWNNELNCTIDVEKLELNWKLAGSSSSDADKLRHYLAAIASYKGEFLPKSLMEEWTMPLRTYYSSIYMDCVSHATELLLAAGKPSDAVTLCEQAVSFEKYTERMHELLIKSYMAANDHASALKHYYYVQDLFFTELGVNVSEAITSLYNEITKSIDSIQADLHMIETQLHEAIAGPGAYFCPYEIFKNIYRIQSRFMLRSGQSFMIALVTIADLNGNPPPRSVIADAMNELQIALTSSLRKSDVVSRFSPTQFVLLLGALTYENGQMIMNRIFDRFHRRSSFYGISPVYNLLPVKPVV